MAQIKNNQVKFGVNVNPKFSNPSFRTQTTTPMSQLGQAQGMTFPSMGALGVTPKLSKGATPLVPGTNNYTPMSIQALGGNNPATAKFSTSTPQTGQTSGYTTNSATNSMQGSLDGIRNQALGIQDLLNKKAAAEAATNTTGVNSRGGIDKPNNPNQTSVQQGFFPGVLQDLLGASKPTKEQERARREMERISAGNKAIADEAKRVSDQYGAEIARVGGLGAGAVAGNLSTGTNVVGSGNAAIASQSASTRMDALAKAQQAALEGTAQQLTGQEQAASAFRPSLEATLTQQQQGITGLSNAANYAQPVQVPYSNQYINPMSGQSAGGAGLGGYAGYNAAQQAIELAGQYPDAGVQYDPNQTPEQNLARIQQALQGSPTFQRNTYGAAGATSYIGGQQFGAAGQLTQKVAEVSTAVKTAESNFDLMLSIAKQAGINQYNVPVLNTLKNKLGVAFESDPNVVAFRQLINSVRGQYANITGGGTATDESRSAASVAIPDDVSLEALVKLRQTLGAEGNNRIAAYNQQINSYSNQGGGGYTGGGSTGGGAGGIFDF